MSRRGIAAWAGLAGILAIAGPLPLYAGSNAAGVASLSWSASGPLTNLDSPPQWQRVPLYLKLENAPDVRKLAVELRWTPDVIVGPCFSVVPDSATVGSCGWLSLQPPGEAFAGDSSYAWSLEFPPSTSPDCVTYWVEGGSCANVAASFCLASVLAMDSEGVIDILAVTDQATILGGVAACPTDVNSLSPTSFAADTTIVFQVFGQNLGSARWAKFRSAMDSISAHALTVVDDSHLEALVTFGATVSQRYDLAIGNDDGTLAVLPNAVEANATTLTAAIRFFDRPGSPPPSSPGQYVFYETCDDETRPQQRAGAIVLPNSVFPTVDPTCTELARVCEYTVQAQFFLPSGAPAANIDIEPQVTWLPSMGHCHEPSTGPPMYQWVNQLLVAGLTSYPTTTDANGYLVFNMVTPEQSHVMPLRYVSLDHRYVAGSSCAINILEGQLGFLSVPQPGDEMFTPVDLNDLRHLGNNWVDARIYPAVRDIDATMEATLILQVDDDGNHFERIGSAIDQQAITGARMDGASIRHGGVVDGTGWVPQFCRHRKGLSVDLMPGWGGRKGPLLYWWLRSQAFQGSPPPLRARPDVTVHSVPWSSSKVIHLEWEE